MKKKIYFEKYAYKPMTMGELLAEVKDIPEHAKVTIAEDTDYYGYIDGFWIEIEE